MQKPGVDGGDLTRMEVLSLIGRRGPTSRAEIARELDLSPATVSQATRRLIEAGLLEPLDFEPSIGGRPAQRLGLVATAGHAVGVKVAEDHVVLVGVSLDGVIQAEATGALDLSSADPLGTVVGALRRFLPVVEGPSPLLGVGVAVPGVVRRPDVGVVDVAVLGWEQVRLGPRLRADLSVPVLVENNVKALAVAERLYGRGRSRRSFAVLTVGRGVGFASVVDGVVWRGATGGAGEIAHVSSSGGKVECGCGRRGCLETVAGEEGLVAAARAAGAIAAREGFDALVRAADRGDRAARTVFARAARQLGRAVAAPLAAVDPELLVVAGEGTGAWGHWDGPFRSALAASMPPGMSGLPVEIDEWDDSNWARGAAAMVVAVAFDRHAHAGRQRPHVLARLQGAAELDDDGMAIP